MEKARLLLMQILLVILAVLFAAAIIYTRQIENVQAAAMGGDMESNVTLYDLARKIGDGRDGNGR